MLGVAHTGRRVLRWSMRSALTLSPQLLRDAAVRIPFSRLASHASRALWGEEVIAWRELRVVANPGETHGYYLFMFGEYATHEIDALLRACARARLFADVGANHGLVSLALARGCPELRCQAFEPERAALARLRRNLQLNPALAARIEVVDSAVSDFVGRCAFTPPDSQNPETGTLNASAGDGGTADVSVPVTTLDAHFAATGSAPDVVKIDVEGAELQVLRGMTRLLRESPPRVLLIEVHSYAFGPDPAAVQREILDRLQAARYAIRASSPAGWVPVGAPAGWPSRFHLLCELRDA